MKCIPKNPQFTGLDERVEEIMEAAVIITDGELNIVATGPELVLHVDPKVLDDMGEWCTIQHGIVSLMP